MTQKWNLQDIRPAEPRKRRVPPREVKEIQTNENGSVSRPTDREHIPSIIIEDGRKKDSNRLVISIVLFVVIVGGAIGLSAILSKTELTIYPVYREPNINAEFTAYPDKRTGSLSYEIMTIESTSEAQVKASGKVDVKEQATGMIEIIKTTAGAERLIKNTRFRTTDGLVFRVKESVVVPGAVKDGQGASVPGTIQAEVFADEVGEQYNVPAGTTFDVPGFKEGGFTDLYNSISARNSQAFNKGFNGPQFQIDESELNTARQQLQVDLRNNLLARIDNEKPADFTAFKDAVAITYNQLTPIQNGQDLVTIREQAVLQIPLFQNIDFGSFLAQESVTTYEGNPVRVDDTSTLTFRYTSATTSSSVIANEPSLSFNLAGKPLLIWEYDSEKIKKDLAGLPKTALDNVRKAYPGIYGAKVHITPFWQQKFPEKSDEIIIIEELKSPEDFKS